MADRPTLYRRAEPPPWPCHQLFVPLGRRTYPGRTDETEQAFEETSMTVDSETILAHLVTRHRQRHPYLDTVSPPNPNPHNRTEEETARWRAYNLGRLHAWTEALNAIRTAQAGKDIGP